METSIALRMEEQKRIEIIQRVFRRELTMAEAAMVLGVTERHSYRIKARGDRATSLLNLNSAASYSFISSPSGFQI